MIENFIVVSSNEISQFEIKEHIGVVQGSTVRGRNVGADIFANLKNVIGGEIVSYSKLLVASREQAYERMIIDAKSKGAMQLLHLDSKHQTLLRELLKF